MKKLVSLTLVMVLVFSIVTNSFAASNTYSSIQFDKYQKALHKLEKDTTVPEDLKESIKKEIDANYQRLLSKNKNKSFNSLSLTRSSGTSYKKIASYSATVKKIKADADEIMLYANDILVGGGIVAALVKKVVIAEYVAVIGGVTYFVGRGVKASVSDLKDDAKFKTNVYFKWTDEDNYEYKSKTKTWVEYKGTRISDYKYGYSEGDFNE